MKGAICRSNRGGRRYGPARQEQGKRQGGAQQAGVEVKVMEVAAGILQKV